MESLCSLATRSFASESRNARKRLAGHLAYSGRQALFQQICTDHFEVRGFEPDDVVHERLDAAAFVDQLENRFELTRREREIRERRVAFEEILGDPFARHPEHLEQHRRADAGAVASGRAME